METDSAREPQIEKLDIFKKWIDNFCKERHLPDYKYDFEVEESLEINGEDIPDLTSQDCYIHAMRLLNYAGYLQKDFDDIKAARDWCEHALNFLFSQYWEQYGGSYASQDVKKKMIIKDNSYAQAVETAMIKMDGCLTVMQEKIKDVRRRFSLMQDMAKMKGFQ